MNDASEKPFDATPARIRKARREGNVPRSSELAANIAFAAAALTVVAVVPMQGGAGASALAAAASGAAARAEVARVCAAVILALALLPLGAAALAGALGSFMQNGGLTLVAVAPKFE
ncbi:MAG: EscU/YscU/HrcU family type III secretion system export apparatus switch protein, partial [Candidatus Eremiobacteraeota bacterium]|nr:EscU/YscU/HrcU family type III secretion system export apparatus switch protein [Candidatus Eremiobacteraeota bacterium]